MLFLRGENDLANWRYHRMFASQLQLALQTIMHTSTYQFTPLPGYEHFEASTQIIIREILARGLDFEIIDGENNLILVRKDGKEYPILEGTISDANSLIAYWISNDKWLTRQFLQRKGLKQAAAVLLQQNSPNLEALQSLSFPLVVKPVDTDHGIGVCTNIQTEVELQLAIQTAFQHSKRVLVEEFISGREYRFLVISGEVRAIAYREPANVVGDGVSSIAQLIAQKNKERGDDYRHPLLKIKIDDEVKRHLTKQQLQLHSLLPANQKVYLRQNSNLSTGGDSIDLTDEMPKHHQEVAQAAAHAAGLNIAGIDIIIPHLSAADYAIIELNAPAMLSMHNYPYIGKNRQVEKHVLDAILGAKYFYYNVTK